jgi:hypothetical protein
VYPGAQQLQQRGLGTKYINFEARRAGPVSIFGPAIGVFGQPLRMTHIACNYSHMTTANTTDSSHGIVSAPSGTVAALDIFHFVTWNDDGFGEYCLWKLAHAHGSVSSGASVTGPKFEYFPRLIVPKMNDRLWLSLVR